MRGETQIPFRFSSCGFSPSRREKRCALSFSQEGVPFTLEENLPRRRIRSGGNSAESPAPKAERQPRTATFRTFRTFRTFLPFRTSDPSDSSEHSAPSGPFFFGKAAALPEKFLLRSRTPERAVCAALKGIPPEPEAGKGLFAPFLPAAFRPEPAFRRAVLSRPVSSGTNRIRNSPGQPTGQNLPHPEKSHPKKSRPDTSHSEEPRPKQPFPQSLIWSSLDPKPPRPEALGAASERLRPCCRLSRPMRPLPSARSSVSDAQKKGVVRKERRPFPI